ncbi:hypothetical protein Fmac_021651 [Flemingia macrophylla]|uniref:Ribosomal protein L20 n=1 Tax=Flemingia macrophylla TaxID=520843 RepID=A0ABD1LXL9_9FABA
MVGVVTGVKRKSIFVMKRNLYKYVFSPFRRRGSWEILELGFSMMDVNSVRLVPFNCNEVLGGKQELLVYKGLLSSSAIAESSFTNNYLLALFHSQQIKGLTLPKTSRLQRFILT